MKEQDNISNEEIDAAQRAAYIAYKLRHVSDITKPLKTGEETKSTESLEKFNQITQSNAHIIEFKKQYATKEESAGFILETKTDIYVAYRGTSINSVEEIHNDTKSSLREITFESPDGILKTFFIHDGFQEEYLSSKTEVNRLLDEIDPEHQKQLIFCGHSLGGAAASIASLEQACAGRQNIKCITFGTPKLFSKESALEFDQLVNCARVIDHKDPVQHYPIFRTNYAHAGQKIETDAGHYLFSHDMPSTYNSPISKSIKSRKSSRFLDILGLDQVTSQSLQTIKAEFANTFTALQNLDLFSHSNESHNTKMRSSSDPLPNKSAAISETHTPKRDHSKR